MNDMNKVVQRSKKVRQWGNTTLRPIFQDYTALIYIIQHFQNVKTP